MWARVWTVEVDLSSWWVIGRGRYKEMFEKKHRVKLGFMSAFVKASTSALEAQPVVNAGAVLIDD